MYNNWFRLTTADDFVVVEFCEYSNQQTLNDVAKKHFKGGSDPIILATHGKASHSKPNHHKSMHQTGHVRYASRKKKKRSQDHFRGRYLRRRGRDDEADSTCEMPLVYGSVIKVPTVVNKFKYHDQIGNQGQHALGVGGWAGRHHTSVGAAVPSRASGQT